MKVLPSNAKSLQPIPKESGIRLNISDNINSPTETLLNKENILNTPTQNSSTNMQSDNTKNVNTPAFYVAWCVIVLLTISVIIFIYKKRKRF